MMRHTGHSFLKLVKNELARLVLVCQIKFDIVLKSVKYDLLQLRNEFTKLESEKKIKKILLISCVNIFQF